MATNVRIPEPFIGELNKRVTIRLRKDVAIGLSGLISQYPTTVMRWADLKPVGTAVWAANVQTDTKVTHRCIVRWLDGITNDYEVVHRGRIYRVLRCAELRGELVFLVMDLEELGNE